jgi:hypothetical protein
MRSVTYGAATAVVAMVAGASLAGCGGGASAPGVAHLGSTATTAPSAAGGSGGPVALGSGGASASGGGATAKANGGADEAKLEAYSVCMRSHGVPSFPDPASGPNGGFGFQIKGGPGTGLDPNSPTFQAADNKCKSLLPNGGVGQPLSPAQQQAFLAWAACIRAHGVPTFPDPDFSGGGVRIRVNGPGNGAAMQAAQLACKPKLPGGFGGLGG